MATFSAEIKPRQTIYPQHEEPDFEMRELKPYEARVLGALIEKEVTTPDHYPLSLNALSNACNQKSNREPVLNLSEGEVQAALDSLDQLSLISEVRFGSRVAKFKHRFCNTEFSEWHLSGGEKAVICLLLLRGPQTAGELRSRSGRLYNFSSVQEVEQCLDKLSTASSPLVCKLEREPGRRENRFMHLLCGEPGPELLTRSTLVPNSAPEKEADYLARIAALEQQVEYLQQEVQQLKDQWAELNA